MRSPCERAHQTPYPREGALVQFSETETPCLGAGALEARRRSTARDSRVHHVPGVLIVVQCAPPSVVRWMLPRTVAYPVVASPKAICGATGAACW